MEEIDELLEVWVHNAYTKKLLHEYEKRLENTFEMLVRACDESEDASVRWYAAEYHQMSEFIHWLKGGE
jgi:hypothetical protein